MVTYQRFNFQTISALAVEYFEQGVPFSRLQKVCSCALCFPAHLITITSQLSLRSLPILAILSSFPGAIRWIGSTPCQIYSLLCSPSKSDFLCCQKNSHLRRRFGLRLSFWFRYVHLWRSLWFDDLGFSGRLNGSWNIYPMYAWPAFDYERIARPLKAFDANMITVITQLTTFLQPALSASITEVFTCWFSNFTTRTNLCIHGYNYTIGVTI